eukprot:gnl/Dysnectes_brevis/279_a311_2785.p1 GENE.gnl/Dysnectes_brevis/279_a311_2785~~gnl/Dysnectes_brevis/279_a311_2785.p1  ORF type:complete len:434 (-),score=84.49 gnl/Dysnectes_brevis/279_a311_2785:2375-3655(-)
MSKRTIDVHVRVRPLVGEELERKDKAISFRHNPETSVLAFAQTNPTTSYRSKGPAKKKITRVKNFSSVLQPDLKNSDVYSHVLAPSIPKVINGETASLFCYGHTGSGKSHTLLGYRGEPGLVNLAIDDICQQLQGTDILVQISAYDIYQNQIFDLLSDRALCEVREGEDGLFHLRSATIKDDKGRVIINPISFRTISPDHPARIQAVIDTALERRRVGSSSLHDESSRSHALIAIEMVNTVLGECRRKEIMARADIPRLKLHCDKLHIRSYRGRIQRDDGSYDEPPTQKQLSAASKAVFDAENALKEALSGIQSVMQATPTLGGALLLVDLAGSEYAMGVSVPREQMREAQQINKSLLSLKECVRCLNKSSPGFIPYRRSKLTMLLRRHLQASSTHTAVVANISPSEHMARKTLNTLQYASMMAGK